MVILFFPIYITLQMVYSGEQQSALKLELKTMLLLKISWQKLFRNVQLLEYYGLSIFLWSRGHNESRRVLMPLENVNMIHIFYWLLQSIDYFYRKLINVSFR